MSKLLFCLATVAIVLTLILFHSTPALPQSNPKQPDLTINTATRLDVIKATIKTLDDYVFPNVASRVQADIHTRLQNGEYNDITPGNETSGDLDFPYSSD